MHGSTSSFHFLQLTGYQAADRKDMVLAAEDKVPGILIDDILDGLCPEAVEGLILLACQRAALIEDDLPWTIVLDADNGKAVFPRDAYINCPRRVRFAAGERLDGIIERIAKEQVDVGGLHKRDGLAVSKAGQQDIFFFAQGALFGQKDIERLVSAMSEIKRRFGKTSAGDLDNEYINPIVKMSPHDAFYSDQETVPIAESSGRVSGEFVMCYPPGIPIVAPGELITSEIVSHIAYCKEKGCFMTGTEDLEIKNIKVISE